MRIPDADLDGFILRWKNAFNEDLTRDQAAIRAGELLKLFAHLARPPAGLAPPPREAPNRREDGGGAGSA